MPRPIAIIHPEGNLANNPHLSGLVDLLLERGREVHLLCGPHHSQQQARRHPLLRVVAPLPPHGPWDGLRGVLHGPDETSAMAWTAVHALPRYALVLGVDLGIVEAAAVARAQGVPHGLISYELYFEEETGPEFKRPEREACRGLAFAVCQDAERAGELARQNGIDPGRILNMPVAGRGARPGERTDALHRTLGLAPEIKLAVVIGSAEAAWTGVPALLEGLAAWPRDWTLVLHHRYSQAEFGHALRGLGRDLRDRVRVSPLAGLPADQLPLLLHACDLGLCFYTPTYQSPLVGRNLVHIGMASGKFCTCMMHGLPVLVNGDGEMARHVAAEGLGLALGSLDAVPEALAALDRPALDAMRPRCVDFFSRRLDLDVTAEPLLRLLDALLAGREGPEIPEAAISGAAVPQPDAPALRGAARLCMAEGDAQGAGRLLLQSLHAAAGERDVELAYLQGLDLLRAGRSRPDMKGPGLAVCEAVAEHRLAAPGLAAWALFKLGEALLDAGEQAQGQALLLRALARNPDHAKAALLLAAPGQPLRVALGPRALDRPAAPGLVRVPMEPLDAGLWGYYFARRRPDEVALDLAGPLEAGDAARLAELLAAWLSPGGVALVGPDTLDVQARAALAAAGLTVRQGVEGRPEILRPALKPGAFPAEGTRDRTD